MRLRCDLLKNMITITLSVLLLVPGCFLMFPAKPALSACSTPATTLGVDTLSVNVTSAGTYRVWARMKASNASDNSLFLQVDSDCAITIGDSPTTTNSWTWIDYQLGDAQSKVNTTLATGAHTLTLIGREAGVQVDRIILTADSGCVPSGTGDNCLLTTPTISVSPTNTSQPSSTPVPITADINNDSKVNIFDLSYLLSKWGTTDLKADLNKDGAVNIFDLSFILSKWTG